jgi:hypothetical protein
MKKNKKKEKIIYIDDGSSVADMSSLDAGRSRKNSRSNSGGLYGRPTFKACFKTYIEAVKMMIVPMLITIGIITVAFLLMYLIL